MQALPQGFLSKSRQRNQYVSSSPLTPFCPLGKRGVEYVYACVYICLSVFLSVCVGMSECALKLLYVQTAKYSHTFISAVQMIQIESPAVFIPFTSICCFRGLDFH